MPANGSGGQNGGGSGVSSGSGYWTTGEGGREWVGGGTPTGRGIDLSTLAPPKPAAPPPKYGEEGYVAKPGEKGFVREAKNVQRANIDRTSYYDPTEATQALGSDYLATRNAGNPQPLGSTGAGAVGYEFTPSDERLY